MKRTFDITVSLCALFFLAPILLGLGILIRLFIGSPVLFVQERPGMSAKTFKLVKFRTMTDKQDANGDLLPDGQRITPFGRFLRRSSLDELPELWNVLKGEMSLVGPRPLLIEYLPLYSPEQARRHEVRPGITGWAQVNGRNAISWEEKLKLDVWYVGNHSFWLDLQILCLTVGNTLLCKGISQQGHATMEKFQGDGRRRASGK